MIASVKLFKIQLMSLHIKNRTHIEEIENSATGNILGYALVDTSGHVYGGAISVSQDIDDVSEMHSSCDDHIFVLPIAN